MAVGATLTVATSASAVESTVPPAPNPALTDQCELDVAVSIDVSNSIDNQQLDMLRSGLVDFAESLEEYPVRLAFHNWASYAPATSQASNQPLRLTDTSGAGLETIGQHVDGIQRPGTMQGGTNWDRAFQALSGAGESYDAVLFVTDGNPTQWGLPPRGLGNATDQATIDAAVTSANQVKEAGTRVIGVGVVDNLTQSEYGLFHEHMPHVSGPQFGDDYLEVDFARLRNALIGQIDKQCAGVSVEKNGLFVEGGPGHAGDDVRYEFTVTNTGALTLRDVQLTDALEGISEIEYGEWPDEPHVLAPGQSVSAWATYTATDADADAGIIENHVTVEGTPPSEGDPVTDDDDHELPVESEEDGGTEDGGTEDGGTEDGGTEDGGTEDGGTEDGGTEDGGTEDGGTEDGGGKPGDDLASTGASGAVGLGLMALLLVIVGSGVVAFAKVRRNS
ncbi:hypothetical protein GCM10009618_04510 [Nesterenkonia lacusekhoensis]